MKKKLALLLVFLILITNITIPAMASATLIEVDASKSNTTVSVSIGNAFTVQSGIKIIEYEFELDSDNPKDAGIFLSRSIQGRAVPVFLDASEQKLHFACGFSDSGELTDSSDNVTVTEGKYYCVALIDPTGNKMKIYVNGSLAYSAGARIVWAHGWHTINAYPGTKAIFYNMDESVTLDNFDYSAWTARLSCEDSVVSVDNTSMVVKAGKEEMTAETLLSKLIIPDGASVKITEDAAEVASDAIITTDMKVDLTLALGNTVSYDIIAGFIPIMSDIYDVSLVLDGNSVASAKISGIKGFTSAEDFLEAITPGEDCAEIIGLEPAGSFVNEEMKLKVKTKDEEIVTYDLELTPSFTTFEEHGGANKIRGLHGLFKGEKSVIKGTAEIPENGLSENIELYFEMDVKQAYPIQFNTDGSINVYGNNVGSYENNSSYDYVIVTDAEEETASAYINGMKVLEKADITSQFTTDDDPYDLVGGSYNPAESGEFLLTAIYSEESFEEAYLSDIAMLAGMNTSVDPKYSVEEGAVVELFINKSNTIAQLSDVLYAVGGGSVKYFDAEGNEIISADSLVAVVARIDVTSNSGLYTNSYLVSFPDEIIKSTLYNVDEEEMTIGGVLHFAPASEVLDTLTIINPDYALDGVYRGENKLQSSDILMEGDVLRITKSSEAFDYLIEYTPDFERDGTTLIFPETSQHVTVFEGEFTVPEEGFTEQAYSVWYKTWATSEGRSVMEFTTDLKLQLWGKEFQLEKGKAYDYAYVHDHKNAAYDFYLNGVKAASASLTSTLAPGTGFDNFWARGPLGEEGGVERAYRVYSRANYVYKNDLTVLAASNKVEVKTGTANTINVKNAECATIGDLLNELSFKSTYAEENAFVSGNGAVISNMEAKLITGMLLTVKTESGFSIDYAINVAHSPITSWVFNVTDSAITYTKGNLTYDDFARYCLLAEGNELVVKKANGEIVTSGNIESGMTATAGGTTYTINLTTAQPVPEISIASIADDEIFRTDETYSKTITASGSGVTGVTVYLDGEKYVLGTSAGSYTFTKDNLTSGRHEIYAVAETETVKAETEHLIFYAFEEETDRVRAALQPVVMEVNYLNSDKAPLAESDTVSYDELSSIELVFNKALSEESITEENISLYLGDTKLDAVLTYEENSETSSYTVLLSDFGMLSSSADYEIRISGEIEDASGNKAEDASKILFRTSPKPFDVKGDSLVNESGNPVLAEELSGGDSVVAKVQLTNTSGNNENGLVILAVYDSNRMVGYSITTFTVEEGTVNKTITTEVAQIDEGASDNLTTYRYIWDGDINDMSTLLRQAVLN